MTSRLMGEKGWISKQKTIAFLIIVICSFIEQSEACSFCLVANCQCCASLFACQTCKTGFYKSGSSCPSCSSPIPNCASCTSASTCTSCNSNSYLSSPTSCPLCSSTMANCLTCTSASVCTACSDPTYYLSSPSVCTLCSTTMSNCNTCSSATACTTCSSTSYYLSSPSTCDLCSGAMTNCVTCTSGTACTACVDSTFYIDSGCTLCSATMSNCLTCSSGTLCTSCIDSTFLIKAAGDGCQTCPILIPSCITCASATACTLCENNTFFNSLSVKCDVCSVIIANCLLCENSTFCTQCVNSTDFFFPTAMKCAPCTQMLEYCEMCNSTTTCNLCTPNISAMNSSSLCQSCSVLIEGCLNCTTSNFCTKCEPTHLLQYTSTVKCVACSQKMYSCGSCTSNTICTSCKLGVIVTNGCSSVSGCIEVTPYQATTSICTLCDPKVYEAVPVNGLCKCKVGVLAGKICTTMPGCTTAIRNSSGEFCLMCSFAKLFVLRNGTCFCKEGFELTQGICTDKCGDGKTYTQPCDDGNLLDGDGCSSSCAVEPDYVCKDGSAAAASRCVYEGMVKLQLLCVYKGEVLNTGKALFQISPFVSNIAKMNLSVSLLFVTNFNLSITAVTYADRVITADFEFREDVEGGAITAELRYDSKYIRSPDASLSFTVDECNSDYLLYVAGAESSFKDFFLSISKLFGYATVLVWAVGSYSHRMVGVETLNTIQFAAVLLSFAEYFQPNFAYLSELRNTLDLYKSALVPLQTAARQTQLFRLNYYPNFTDNTAVVGILVYGSLFLMGALLLTERVLLRQLVTDEEKQHRYRATVQRLRGATFDFLVFPTLIGFFVNTLTSASISSIKSFMKTDPIAQAQSLSIVMLLTLTSIVFFQELKHLFLSQNKTSKRLKCKPNYVSLYLINLTILTLYLQLSIQDYLPNSSNIFLLTFLSLFTLYIILGKPYQKTVHNIGLIINHSGLIFIQSILFLQGKKDENEHVYIMVIYGWIGLVLLWALIRAIYQLKQQSCNKKQERTSKDPLIIQEQNNEIAQQIKYYHNHLDNLRLPLASYFQRSLEVTNLPNFQEQSKYLRLFNKHFKPTNINQGANDPIIDNTQTKQQQFSILRIDN